MGKRRELSYEKGGKVYGVKVLEIIRRIQEDIYQKDKIEKLIAHQK
jgi:hypothetical protein